MAAQLDSMIRTQLTDRRHRLVTAISAAPETRYLNRLLAEVDAALTRMDTGIFGLCEECHENIESDRLAADPLVRFCLEHLTPPEQRALEQDLVLAASIQSALLPRKDFKYDGWRMAYHYQPLGPVSGDYCDLVTSESGDLYFMLGDVSGKGVAASMLMAHLHAMFRALIGVGIPLVQLMERASRVFCESTLANHYATLVCGKIGKHGEVEICNAGHLPPLLVTAKGVKSIDATGLPLGMFCGEEFGVVRFTLATGDRIILVTDGLAEAKNRSGLEFGMQSLAGFARSTSSLAAPEFVQSLVREAEAFSTGTRRVDDLTVLVLDYIG